MKKTIIYGFISVIVGIVLGKYLNIENFKSLPTFKTGESYYFLQEGIYSSEENLAENTKNIETKLVEKSNDKYYVYLGITKNLKVAEKLKQLYENQGYQVYIKEVELKNEEFYNNVTQFDLLLNNDISESEMLTIEEVVLANYEEITRKESWSSFLLNNIKGWYYLQYN